MPKRKYTKINETPVSYECTNRKCKWNGLHNEKQWKKINSSEKIAICPKCDNDEFYGLL